LHRNRVASDEIKVGKSKNLRGFKNRRRRPRRLVSIRARAFRPPRPPPHPSRSLAGSFHRLFTCFLVDPRSHVGRHTSSCVGNRFDVDDALVEAVALDGVVVEDVVDRGRLARATPYAIATESALITHTVRRLVPGNR